MHLKEKVNNDLNKASSSKRNGESKKYSSSPTMKKVFLAGIHQRGATQPKIMAKKRSLLIRKTDKIGSALKYKLLMQSINPFS